MPRLETDLVDVFEAIAQERLSEISLKWKPDAAVCVVVASKGYPGSYEKGKVIQGLDQVHDHVHVIHAGTAASSQGDGSEIMTNGGRVLGVIGMDVDLSKAIQKTYDVVPQVTFEGAYYRSDIGQKALR